MAAFYILPSRFWEILSGGLLVCSTRQLAPSTGISSDAKALLAVAIILVFSFMFDRFMLFPGWALVPCCATFMLLSAGKDAWLNRTVLSSPPAVFIGRISYPFYLWHWPLLSLAQMTEGGEPSPGIRFGAVVIAFVLAWLTFRFVEQPIQKAYRFRNWPQWMWIRIAAVTILIAAMGYMGFTRNDFLRVLPRGVINIPVNGIDQASIQRALDRNWWPKNQYVDALCKESSWNSYKSADYCRLTGTPPRVAIIGDSHSNHLVPGLASLNDPVFSHMIEMAFGGCTAFDHVQIYYSNQPAARVRDCYLANQDYYEKIRNDKDIRIVIISLFLHADKYYDELYGLSVNSFSAESHLSKIEALREGLSRTIGSFEKAGKQVIFFIDVPNLDFYPLTCLNVRPFSITAHKHTICARPRQDVQQEQAEPRALIKELAALHPDMTIFDPLPFMCDADYCYGIRNGKILYRDENHLSLDGSIFLAHAFMASLKIH